MAQEHPLRQISPSVPSETATDRGESAPLEPSGIEQLVLMMQRMDAKMEANARAMQNKMDANARAIKEERKNEMNQNARNMENKIDENMQELKGDLERKMDANAQRMDGNVQALRGDMQTQ